MFAPVSRLFLFIVLIALAIFFTCALASNQAASHLGLRVAEKRLADGGFAGVVDGKPAAIFGVARLSPGGHAPDLASVDGFERHAADRPDDAVFFEADDFIEEPDMLASYAASNRFMARQGALAEILRGPFTVVYRSGVDAPLAAAQILPAPDRDLSQLGSDFFVQIGAASCMLLIAAFLVTLRPGNGPALAFAMSGLGAAVAALTAAIYSSRDIALDVALFRTLSVFNQIGTFLFGIGVIYLFAVYPVRLVSWRQLWPVPLVCGLLVFAYRLQLLPHEWVTPHIGIVLLLVGIVVLVVAQYRATRGNPADRAVMLWLGMSVITGAGSFVLFVTVPVVMGLQVVLSQSVAFVPLAAIYAGIAVGIARYRLFDLGRWAYRLAFYTLAIMLIVAADLAIAFALRLSPSNSLGAAVLLAGFVYILFRDLALRRMLAQRQPEIVNLYRQTNAVAFQPSAAGKEENWARMITGHFNPMASEFLGKSNDGRPCLLEEGLGLAIPAYPWSRAMTLQLAERGGRLFNRRDLDLVEQLASLVQSAESDRLSYEQGVLEERRRIAMDLHDDVGARLLSGLHARSEAHRQESIMDALSDIRQISSGLIGRDVVLSELIGHLRHETRNRAEMHGFTLDWPLTPADDSQRILPYQVHRNFNAAHREALSNALKHGLPGKITVRTEESEGQLIHEISNASGDPEDAAPHREGRRLGSGNIRLRATRLNGSAETEWRDGRFMLRLVLPLAPTGAGE
ncbi:sensor histidine kinase [Metarhizobium album]|uniref:sensor histidine kinase n=1 Tax=Metarhizobium album TaxID=2182425 RepID=UPI001402AC7C|nr:hypothetical protein [Rhizobium album]